MDGSLSGINGVHVRLEVMKVLVMDPVEVTKARHTDGQDVGAGEEAIPVHKLHLGGITNDGRRAGHGVSDLFKPA